MRVPRTLYLYVAREIVTYGAIAFFAITAIMLGQNLLRRLEDLVVVGFSAGDLAAIGFLLVGMLVAYATPIAFLFGVSLTTSRLSGDAEVLAMRANGIGLRPLVVPALALGACVSVLTGYLMTEVEPRAQRELRTMLKSVAARGGVLEAGKFRDVLGRVIFVESRGADDRLEGVLISDRTNEDRPFVIFAEHGRLHFDPDASTILFSLENGDVHIEPESPPGGDESYRRIAFQSFDYEIDVSSIFSGKTTQLRPREMSNGDLRESAFRLAAGEKMGNLREKDPIEYQLQLHRRYALPFAPILFGMLAVPLSLRGSRSARSWGALQSVAVVFAYYSLMTFAQYLAREGWLSAGAALWLPNAVLALSASSLLWAAHRRVAS